VNSWDVIVVGGGIIGTTCALLLAKRGARTLLVDRGVPGAEASSCGSGSLSAQVEADGPGRFTDLCLASRNLYGDFTSFLTAQTGIDVGYRRCGALRISAWHEQKTNYREEVLPLLAWQQAAGLAVHLLEDAQVATLEPALVPRPAVLYPDEAQVDPCSLFQAVYIAAVRAKVDVRSGCLVRAVHKTEGRADGVTLEDGTWLRSGHVVLAAGSWSALVQEAGLEPTAVRPSRGQLLELKLRTPPLRRMIFGPGVQLLPQEDGRIIVGTTLEFVGYQREVTARAVRDLLHGATALCPALEGAALTGTWSNFRPYAEGGPLLGDSDVPGLVWATGHYRHGILLAPLTADVVVAAVEGKEYKLHRSTEPGAGGRPVTSGFAEKEVPSRPMGAMAL
jgi:glycine oxidase